MSPLFLRSQGMSDLSPKDDLSMPQSNSDHGGTLFKLFPGEFVHYLRYHYFRAQSQIVTRPLSSRHNRVRCHPPPCLHADASGALDEGAPEREDSFKLFGDVEPLALSLSGEGPMTSEQSFRLFGGLPPMALR